ncbi:MAG TPA: oligosaccharide flippase family protein [Thermoanaerobaculia bacterium]|jgi:PST family polysaccharide transporter
MRELLAAIAKTAGGSAAAMLAAAVAVKIIAVVAGTEGVGLFSILRQAQQTAVLLALLNGQNALVQGIASRADEQERRTYINTAMGIVAILTAIVVGVLAVAPALLLRGLRVEAGVARVLALSVACGALSGFAAGILTGHRLIGRAAAVTVVNYVLVAAFALPAARAALRGHAAAFSWQLAAGTAAAAAFAWTAVVAARLTRLERPRWSPQVRAAARHFLGMASTLTIAAAAGYGLPLLMRMLIVRHFGFSGAGLFDVAWTLSMTYVMLILTGFSAYYLPALSGIRDPAERIELIGRVLRLAVILMLPLVTLVVVAKPLLVRLLYSEQFLPSLRIMRWMLIGDALKIVSWVFSYTMVAYADNRMYAATELIWGALAVGSVYLAVHSAHSLELIGVSFLVLYAAYLVLMSWYVRRRHAFPLRLGARGVAAALAVIVAASLVTWNDVAMRWPFAIGAVLAAAAVSTLLLSADERNAALRWLRLRAA